MWPVESVCLLSQMRWTGSIDYCKDDCPRLLLEMGGVISLYKPTTTLPPKIQYTHVARGDGSTATMQEFSSYSPNTELANIATDELSHCYKATLC